MEAPLFLEQGENNSVKRNLNGVYVLPHLKDTNISNENLKKISLSQSHPTDALISCFVDGELGNFSTLIIQGAPGSGKTSLISYLSKKHNDCGNLFNTTKVFCVSLIALAKQFKNTSIDETPIEFIIKYFSKILGYTFKEELLNNSLLLLDGLDEICTIEHLDISKFCDAIIDKSFFNERVLFRVIITSRLGYIKTIASKKVLRATLAEFSTDELEEFGSKYFSFMPLSLEKLELKQKFMLNKETILKNEKYESIFCIPILLYIITTLGYVLSSYANICEIYESLFDTLEMRLYNSKLNPSEQKHPVINIIDTGLARKIAQNIAYEMLEHNSLSLSLYDESYLLPIKNAIKNHNLFLSDEIKDRIQELFLLTFYYKSTQEIVEFAHKTIQEYFVAEKIRDDLLFLANESNVQSTLDVLLKLFGRGFISSEIYSFLICLINKLSLEKKGNLFNILCSQFINLIDNDYIIDSMHSKCMSSRDCVYQTFVIIWNILKTLNNGKRIIDSKEQLKFVNLLHYALYSFHRSNMDEIPICLDNEDFQNMILDGISFQYASLYNVNFINASIKNTNWTNASVFNADFTDSKLNGSEFTAKLHDCKFSNTLFINSKLSGIILSNINMKLCDFSVSYLSYAYFEYCELICCKFIGSDLKGCYSINTNFSGSTFCGADLRECEFIDCNFIGADFSSVTLGNTIFKNAIIDAKEKHQLEIIGAIFEYIDPQNRTIND